MLYQRAERGQCTGLDTDLASVLSQRLVSIATNCKHRASGDKSTGTALKNKTKKNSQRCKVEVPVFPMWGEYLTIYRHKHANLARGGKTQGCKNSLSPDALLRYLTEFKECVEFKTDTQEMVCASRSDVCLRDTVVC